MLGLFFRMASPQEQHSEVRRRATYMRESEGTNVLANTCLGFNMPVLSMVVWFRTQENKKEVEEEDHTEVPLAPDSHAQQKHPLQNKCVEELRMATRLRYPTRLI